MKGGRILVIKLGALGDFLFALGSIQGIRAHHADARITLLTRPTFQKLAAASGLFDDIWLDEKPKLWNLRAICRFRRRLRAAGFARIYDLQTSDRTRFYYRLLGPGPRPEWSGVVSGCSHYHHYTRPNMMHVLDRHREQLQIAGLPAPPRSDLSFMADAAGAIDRFAIAPPFVLLIPGSSAVQKVLKRWPAAYYGELACRIAARGRCPVLIGGAEETDALAAISAACPEAINLEGKTDLFEIAALAHRAEACVGNDTGPMHLAALANCPTVAVFSNASFPGKAGPRGPAVQVLARDDLHALTPDEVDRALLSLPSR